MKGGKRGTTSRGGRGGTRIRVFSASSRRIEPPVVQSPTVPHDICSLNLENRLSQKPPETNWEKHHYFDYINPFPMYRQTEKDDDYVSEGDDDDELTADPGMEGVKPVAVPGYAYVCCYPSRC